MEKKYYLAIDIGASSGRHIVGYEENGELRTDEVYRFPNGMKKEGRRLVWDIGALFEHVKEGIRAALKKYPVIESLAIDTWGCDYVLMKGDEEILPCHAYRDSRTEEVVEGIHALMPFEELYERTGIQFQLFNTLYQLAADKKAGRLSEATDFLMIPEYLAYKLTGVKKKEYTNATTTGLVNAHTGGFDEEIIEKLNLPKRLFGELHLPGEPVGELKKEIAREVGGTFNVVLCATHDTASAVEGIPMEEDAPYISSGTWSLFGIKSKSAICTAESRKSNWTNEGGVGYIRYLKNIMGMWIVNELKKDLCPEKPFSEIVKEAEESSFNEFVDVNAPVFLAPPSMKEAVDNWFKEEADKPQTVGDYFRCAYLSLAFCYMQTLEELQKNTGKKYSSLYIVGGGAKNDFLNELTGKACKIQIKALPIEATAVGNLKIQMGL